MRPRRTLVIGNTDGIGLALTRRLLDAGDVVTGVSRRATSLETDGRYEHVVADVAGPDYTGRLREIVARRGPFDLCVYCAGIGDRFEPADLSREAEVFRVNLVGAVETAAAVLPAMLAAGGGHLVALSSIGDEVISAEAPSYVASKAGLSSYLAGLALALRPRGVAISNIRFGFVDTKMAKSPLRPMMISVERAVDVFLRCLETRRPRVTYPWSMGLLVKLLRLFALLRLRLLSPPARR